MVVDVGGGGDAFDDDGVSIRTCDTEDDWCGTRACEESTLCNELLKTLIVGDICPDWNGGGGEEGVDRRLCCNNWWCDDLSDGGSLVSSIVTCCA